MKLYFAGSFSGISIAELRGLGVHRKLYSYANDKKQIQDWGSAGLLLDSGAFTVFTKKIVVDLVKLTTFIEDFRPELAIQLDVIGDTEKTWENYCWMKERVDILPVIHFSAPDSHIVRVLNSAPYICLGGLVPYKTRKRILWSWLDYIFSFSAAQDKKFHALGVSDRRTLERYPFYSVDSSSALSVQRYPQKDWKLRVLQKTIHYTKLYSAGIRDQLELEHYITVLWKKRGVLWDAR